MNSTRQFDSTRPTRVFQARPEDVRQLKVGRIIGYCGTAFLLLVGTVAGGLIGRSGAEAAGGAVLGAMAIGLVMLPVLRMGWRNRTWAELAPDGLRLDSPSRPAIPYEAIGTIVVAAADRILRDMTAGSVRVFLAAGGSYKVIVDAQGSAESFGRELFARSPGAMLIDQSGEVWLGAAARDLAMLAGQALAHYRNRTLMAAVGLALWIFMLFMFIPGSAVETGMQFTVEGWIGMAIGMVAVVGWLALCIRTWLRQRAKLTRILTAPQPPQRQE
jgi:hypothetical protein